MYKVIKIGGKDVEMVANAATPIRYRQIFHKDLLAIITGSKKMNLGDFCTEIAFIMAKQAEKADMNKLNEESYIEWLEGFNPLDLYGATDDIWDVFNGTGETDSDPK